MDDSRDVSAAMQFTLAIPAGGAVTLGFNYVGGSLQNAVFLSGLPGDFNRDGVLGADDINDLTTQSSSGSNAAGYDLNNNAQVDSADVVVWVKDLFKSWMGDANLDGEFSSSDLVAVLSSGTYEADVDAVWTTGDFNGDGRTNSSDLVVALTDGGYELGPRAAVSAVPEPTAALLAAMAVALLICRRRRA